MAVNHYFGIELSEIKKNCVICPVSDHDLFKELGSCQKSSGLFAKIINYPQATIISTKNNFLVGDIVLQLKNTLCENVILFGSCGGVADLKTADKIIIKKNVNFESFSEMLEMKRNPDVYYPSPALVEEFTALNPGLDILKVNGATTSSIFLERIYKDWFVKNKISVIDMETSSVFAATSYINKRAIALLYVTDIISEESIFAEPDEQSKKNILASRLSLAKSICNFITNG